MAKQEHSARCVYELDQHLALRAVGQGWNEFAIENGASELVWPRPLGQPLWLYVADATTVHLYELLFARVARTQRALSFPIRCDGPARRRHLTLTLSAGAAGGYVIATELLHSEPRHPILFLDRTVERRSSVALDVCGWCSRVHVEDRWIEVEHALVLLRLFDRLHPPPLRDSVCPACRDFMLAMLADDALHEGPT